MPDLLDPNPTLPSATLQPFDDYSRYRGLALLTGLDAAGREILYVDCRIIPQPQSLAQAASVTVNEGDRLDTIATRILGDARWWWRIADGNGALDPSDLTKEPGQMLRITLPQGVALPSAS